MTTLVAEKKWTYSEYLTTQDGEWFEIIDGEKNMSPAPSSSHQGISRDIGFLIWDFIKKNKLGTVFYSPIDVVFDEEYVLQPDIVFVAKENDIIQERGIFGSPDLVIEILSPSSHAMDMFTKKDIYEKFGVREYWIVDGANKTIEIFVLNKGSYDLYANGVEKGKVSSSILTGFSIELVELWYEKQ